MRGLKTFDLSQYLDVLMKLDAHAKLMTQHYDNEVISIFNFPCLRSNLHMLFISCSLFSMQELVSHMISI
jgi:hypothetical protein